jgi:hypothetical protein
MPKRPHLHTLESVFSQAQPDGDCIVWQGYTDSNSGRAEIYVGPPIAHTGAMWQVRRLVAWLSGCATTIAQAKRPGRANSVYTTTCGDPLCIAPAHIKRITRAEHARAMSLAIPPAQRVVIGIKVSQTHRARPGALTPEQRHDAMHSTDSLAVIAKRIGRNKSTVRRLRVMATNTANPFAQLLRHTGTLPNPRRGQYAAQATTRHTTRPTQEALP